MFERTTDDQNGECNEQGRSLRQRIIAAQIRDSEVGLEELALTDGDNFDASVENVSLFVAYIFCCPVFTCILLDCYRKYRQTSRC